MPSEDQDNKEPMTDDRNKDDVVESEDDKFDDGDTGGTNGNTFYDKSLEQTYDYEDDDYGDDGY